MKLDHIPQETFDKAHAEAQRIHREIYEEIAAERAEAEKQQRELFREITIRNLKAAGLGILAGVLVWLVLALTACSSVRQIGNAAREAQAQATEGVSNLDAAIATGAVGEPAVPYVEAARGNFQSIIGIGQQISDVVASGKVRDTEGWLTRLLGWAGFAAVAFVLIYFAAPIRAALAWIAAKIGVMSKATKAQAEADTAWEADPTPVDATDVPAIKAMAVREATDPAYRVAKAKASKG